MAARQAIHDWLLSLKQPDGSFVMHKGGEVDVRYGRTGFGQVLQILRLILLAEAAIAR